MQLKEYIDDTEDFINIKLVRASPTTICKIPSEKVQLFILATVFFYTLSNRFSILLSTCFKILFLSFLIIFYFHEKETDNKKLKSNMKK
jgi:hypothetical protein